MFVFHRFRFALAGGASLALLAGSPDAAGEQAQKPCADWNTESFFEGATVADVSRCVAAGADVEARDDDDRTPLHNAAFDSESPSVVKALLDAGADPEARDVHGFTPLHVAAYVGAPSVVAVLLKAGADLEARSRHGQTPLHLAAAQSALWQSEALSVVMGLLEAGADLAVPDEGGRNPARRATTNDKLPFEAVGLLSAHKFPCMKDADDTSP